MFLINLFIKDKFYCSCKIFLDISKRSTLPLSITRILSLSATVFKRWAIVKIVLSRNLSLITAWISESVCWSILAVASSINNILLCLRIARATHINWHSPTLKLLPDSDTDK
jgi:hypothetical protein